MLEAIYPTAKSQLRRHSSINQNFTNPFFDRRGTKSLEPSTLRLVPSGDSLESVGETNTPDNESLCSSDSLSSMNDSHGQLEAIKEVLVR